MKKPTPTLVGAFILGALALAAAGVLFFGAGALEKQFRFVSFFHGSVAGLQVGAPVTFRGVPVGEVRSIGIRFNPGTDLSIVQVNMALRPEAVELYGARLRADEELVPTLVERGLTAQLVRQSFVTGLLNIELDFRPGADASRVGEPTAVPQVPTVPTNLEAIARKLETVDIAAALESAEQTLASVNKVLSNPQLIQTMEELPALVRTLRRTLQSVNREVAQVSAATRADVGNSAAALQKTLASVQTLVATLDREAQSTLGATRGALESASTTLNNADALLDPRGRTMIQVRRAVDDLAATAARLRSLAERLDRNPSTLIWGR